MFTVRISAMGEEVGVRLIQVEVVLPIQVEEGVFRNRVEVVFPIRMVEFQVVEMATLMEEWCPSETILQGLRQSSRLLEEVPKSLTRAEE